MEIAVEALYFQAREAGVAYGIVEERVQEPHFNSRFGGRGRLTVPIPHDCWALSAQFLHYHARCSASSHRPIFPDWGHVSFAETSKNLWRLHMGIGDLFLSREWAISPCMTLQPLWGLSYAMIRHKLFVDYESVGLSMKDKYWGIGPVMGAQIAWKLWGNFSIESRGILRMLLGQVYLHQDEDGGMDLRSVFNKIQHAWEFQIGLKWCFGCLEAMVGYEMHLFPSINQLARFSDLVMFGKIYGNQGDLSLHGLSFGLAIRF